MNTIAMLYTQPVLEEAMSRDMHYHTVSTHTD